MPPGSLRSIGQVLAALQADFPDISISKIRFLETGGLISPERAPSGYRRYSPADIERLRYILTMQRDHYLPLKVIREHLENIDRGIESPNADTLQLESASDDQRNTMILPSNSPTQGRRTIRFTRRELIQTSGLSEATLIELERQQMVLPRRGSMYYGREALTICVVARKLQSYGMDTRHLRAIKQSAEREASLVEQAVQPYLRQSAKDGIDVTHEVNQLVVHAHAAMMYTLTSR